MLGINSGVVWHQMQVKNMYDLALAKKALDTQTKQITEQTSTNKKDD